VTEVGHAAHQTRVAPHDLEAEESLLGAMLLSNDAAVMATDVVWAGDFYKPAHGHIFTAMAALLEQGAAIDAVTVGDQLDRAGLLEAIGNPSIFISLQANTPSIANARHYAQIVAEHSRLRQMDRLSLDLSEAVHLRDAERQATIIESLGSVAAPSSASSSWDPIDLRDVTLEQVEPELLERSDGRRLMYRGKVHSVNGESEAGKSHLAQSLSATEIRAGRHVVYIDFETDPASIKVRMLEHGATMDELGERFHYIDPEELLSASARRRLSNLLDRVGPTLVVIDGVAEALVLEGLDENSAADVTAFLQALPRLCAGSGAAVAMIDHPVKSVESQGRYARGSGAKLAGVDVAFKMSSVAPFSHGHDGHSRLEVVKDRYGLVRSLQVGRVVADVMLCSLPAGAIVVELCPPQSDESDPTTAGLRPSARRVLAALEDPSASGAGGLGVSGIGDLLAIDGRGQPLKVRTIQAALKELHDASRAVRDERSGLWRATRAQSVEPEGESDA
jgi:hypothetical protein